MSESKNTLQNAASWAAIIACFIAVLSYFGINPFNENESDSTDSISLNENNVSNTDSYITENNFDKTNKESKIITLETAKEMPYWEFLLIPFKKHEEVEYIPGVFEERSSLEYLITIVLLISITLFPIFWLIGNLGYKPYSPPFKIPTKVLLIIIILVLYYLSCFKGFL